MCNPSHLGWLYLFNLFSVKQHDLLTTLIIIIINVPNVINYIRHFFSCLYLAGISLWSISVTFSGTDAFNKIYSEISIRNICIQVEQFHIYTCRLKDTSRFVVTAQKMRGQSRRTIIDLESFHFSSHFIKLLAPREGAEILSGSLFSEGKPWQYSNIFLTFRFIWL